MADRVLKTIAGKHQVVAAARCVVKAMGSAADSGGLQPGNDPCKSKGFGAALGGILP